MLNGQSGASFWPCISDRFIGRIFTVGELVQSNWFAGGPPGGQDVGDESPGGRHHRCSLALFANANQKEGRERRQRNQQGVCLCRCSQ